MHTCVEQAVSLPPSSSVHIRVRGEMRMLRDIPLYKSMNVDNRVQVLACSKLGRDKARPVRLFLPSRDTATGYNFLESIFESDGDDQSCANSASPVQIGQHVVIYSNFADIMQRVSNDECAVGVVPHMIAKEKIKGRVPTRVRI